MSNWFHNGEAVGQVAIDNRGLQYGDGLFETIAIRDGKPRLWSLHMNRLANGCSRLKMPAPERGALTAQVSDAVSNAGFSGQDAVLKLLLTRGGGPRAYRPPADADTAVFIGVFDRTRIDETMYIDGADTRFCDTRLSIQPITAGLKTLGRLDQVLARAEWQDERIFEGLMQDPSGNVVCGTMSNLFMVIDGSLTTPILEECGVAGIMRQHIIDIAEGDSIRIRMSRISDEQFLKADEVFVCNSQIGIVPVRSCGGRQFQRGPVTRKLMSVLHTSGVHEGIA